jgi:hypothetical protein
MAVSATATSRLWWPALCPSPAAMFLADSPVAGWPKAGVVVWPPAPAGGALPAVQQWSFGCDCFKASLDLVFQTGRIVQLDTLAETICPRLRGATGGPDRETKLLRRLLSSKVLAVCADVFRRQLLVLGEQYEPKVIKDRLLVRTGQKTLDVLDQLVVCGDLVGDWR